MRRILLIGILFAITIPVLAQPAVQPADKAVAPAVAAANRAEMDAQMAADNARFAADRAAMDAAWDAANPEERNAIIAANKAEAALMNANFAAANMAKMAYNPMMYAQLNPNIAAANTILKATGQGLFVIGGGMVAKYDAKTLAPLGNLRLIDTPALPNIYGNITGTVTTMTTTTNMKFDGNTLKIDGIPDWQKSQNDRNSLMAVPVAIVDDKDLIIIMGSKFFRVGMEKVNLIAAADIAIKDANGAFSYSSSNTGGDAPTVQLVDTILYVMRAGNIWSLNAADGKELGQTNIPAELIGNQGFMGGFGFGGIAFPDG